jgi:hypothetical protein
MAIRASKARRLATPPAERTGPVSGAVDAGGQADAHSPQPQGAGEADPELEVARRVAKRMGWVPKEEWTRDPAKWTDAPEFLERTPTELATVKDRLHRVSRTVEESLAETRRRAREEAEAELRDAATSGNADAAIAASRKVAENSGPDPRVTEWIARNPWFRLPENRIAAKLAFDICEELAKKGIDLDDQLDQATREVRKRFPELFEAPTEPKPNREETRQDPPPSPQRLADVPRSRTPPATAGGSRGASNTGRVKTWDDMPKEARDALKPFERQGATREGLAKRYWDEHS